MQNTSTTSTSERLSEPLTQRPEALTLKIEDLLAEVRRGRVRLPAFQRGFRWRRSDALQLLDSIDRGYPIGTLLFWQTRAVPETMKFGTVEIPAGERADAWLVVDGQQRVWSLVRVLLASTPSVDPFALSYDLEDRRVVAPSTASLDRQPWRYLPLTEVVDSQRLMGWVFARDAVRDSPLRDVAFGIGKRIREYPVVAYVVRSETDDALREVFGRVNSTGRPMKADEVFDALNGVRSGGRPSSFQQIVDDVASLGFGVVESRIVHRLARVLRGQDATERGGEQVPRLDAQVAQELYAETAKVMRRVADFLTRSAGISRYEFLPYTQPLVTLGWFFHHHPQPSARSLDLLSRWVWRGALTGAHRGEAVSTRRVIKSIDGDEHASVRRLLEGVGSRPPRLPDATGRFDFGHADSKLETLALLDLGPLDVDSGSPIDARTLAEAPKADMFPPKLFTSRAGEESPLFATVANRLAHPWRSGLTRDLEFAEDESIRASHALGAKTHVSDRTAQLAARQSRLALHLRDFFERRARWDETDRPPIASLVETEDDQA